MKKSFYFLLVIVAVVLSCKKPLAVVDVTPEPIVELRNPGDFLSSLNVTGASKVHFDSTNNSFMVSLPDNYNEEKAEIKLSLKPNILLLDSLDKLSEDSLIYYRYQGTSPLMFQLQDKTGKYWFHYTIYFNFSGTPEMELLQKEIPISASSIKLPLLFKGRIGSNPSSPNQSGPIVKVINEKTGFSKESPLYENSNVAFDSAQYLITKEPMTLEIKFFNQNPIIFKNIKFIRGLPTVRTFPDYKVTYSHKDTIKSTGGYFLPNAKYTATFSSDFLLSSVTVPSTAKDINNLTVDKIPSNLIDGSYLVSFSEEDKLIGKSTLYVSDSDIKCLETIWKGEIYGTLDRNSNALVLKSGDTFYAKPYPVEYVAPGRTSYDVKNLPVLRLKSGNNTIHLTPELVIFNWGIAGVSYSLGQYVIPTDLSEGSYEVTGVYSDKTQTKPYWSKLRIL